MTETEEITYESIYYSLWETARRYSRFCQFRVIGNSHDERMIPMVEIGTGQDAVFCLSGVCGTEELVPWFLAKMVQEYCHACECGWQLEDFYEADRLLDRVRLCVIPLLNPDGYEICRKGFLAVRNPIYRQMLKMQSIPHQEFACNARGMDISRNFPTAYYTRQRVGQEPASENETKALIRIFQEYKSRGLLYFCQSGKKIVYYKGLPGAAGSSRTYQLARHLQKKSAYRLEKFRSQEPEREAVRRGMGTPEQFYTQLCGQPAFRIETPILPPGEESRERAAKKAYEEIHLLALEYIFSLEE